MMASLLPTIRRSQATDLAAVLTLLQDAGLPTDDLSYAPSLHLWVFEADESLCGVIGLERFGTGALLRSLAVAPGYQQRGLGTSSSPKSNAMLRQMALSSSCS